jgi:putative ABC transport system permease protein
MPISPKVTSHCWSAKGRPQIAADLGATPGTSVTMLGTGRKATVTGIAGPPNALSLFQIVGAPAGSGASAPPDKVVPASRRRFRPWSPAPS